MKHAPLIVTGIMIFKGYTIMGGLLKRAILLNIIFVYSVLGIFSPSVFAEATNIYQQLQWPFYDSEDAACIQENVGSGGASLIIPPDFTLKEKIGQLMVVEVDSKDTAVKLAEKYQIGGVYANQPAAVTSLYAKSATDEVKKAGQIPALIAVDEEGGLVQRLKIISGDVPSAEDMGKMPDDQVEKIAENIGFKMAQLGITVNFAPVTDLLVAGNTISANHRAFSADPDTVAQKADAFAQGMRAADIVPTFKHFPGLGHSKGSTDGNTDLAAATTLPLAELEKGDLKPYEELLKNSPSTVMMGNQTVPGLTNGPVSLDSGSYKYLRDKYQFDQVVFTDSLPGWAPGSTEEKVVSAIAAGADMPLLGLKGVDEVGKTINAVEQAVKSDKIKESQIDASLQRILKLKNVSQLPTGTGGSQVSSLDKFLQALSSLETGGTGSPTVDNGVGAYGKYQYQDGTWASSVGSYYDIYKPELASKQHANQAPEAVQDAVTYLEYIKKARDYNGDVGKMAASHLYPAVVDKPELWPTTRDGFGTSVADYINIIIKKIQSNEAANIKLHYNEAPEFQRYLAEALKEPVPGLTINGTSIGGSTVGSSDGCKVNAGGSIVDTAINLSWPESHGLEAKPEYAAAIRSLYPGAPDGGADCGSFVGIVMRLSGADKNYPQSGSSNQEQYVRQHPELYELIQTTETDTNRIFQPSDILIVNPADGRTGHTAIWLGTQANGKNVASASQDTRMPSLSTLSSPSDTEGRGPYLIARLKSGQSSASSPSTPAVSGTSQELAKQILANGNIDLEANNSCRYCKEDITNTMDGKPAYDNVNIDVNLLKFLLALGQTTKVNVNSITGDGFGHSDLPPSNHYSGTAIDFECGLDVAQADSIGKKYGITRFAGENCQSPQPHWHYSTTGN